MKSLNTYISEKLIINKSFKNACDVNKLFDFSWQPNGLSLICQNSDFNEYYNIFIDNTIKNIDVDEVKKFIDRKKYILTINKDRKALEILFKQHNDMYSGLIMFTSVNNDTYISSFVGLKSETTFTFKWAKKNEYYLFDADAFEAIKNFYYEKIE